MLAAQKARAHHGKAEILGSKILRSEILEFSCPCRGYREEEGAVSRPRPSREAQQQQQRGELSPRQRARLADMSLLLDVVLKTNTLR
jgi:hypothetical protein